MYYQIEPEVSGEWGNETIVDVTTHPPVVKKLHYLFNGWLGDDIVETFPCFIITERLKNALEDNNITGFYIDNVKVTKSEEFKELFKNTSLPKFYWFKINGLICINDVFLHNNILTVSENVLCIFKKFNIHYSDIEPIIL